MLLIIDFSNFIVRHASVPGQRLDLLGRPIGGALGALTQVQRLIDERYPSHLLIARDDKRSNSFRRELSPAYKAHRADADEDLARQFTLAYEAVELLGWPALSVPRYEADDIIASAACRYDGQVVIATADKDLLALVNDRIKLWMARPGGAQMVGPDGCRQILGCDPRQVRDYKSLVGDASDGISGITGIGPKSAVKLLAEYGSVAEAYRRLDSGEALSALPAAVVRRLIAGRDQARLSWQLAGLVTSLEIDHEALTLGPRKSWAEIGEPLAELGLADFQGVLDGTMRKARSEAPDLDLAFRQLGH